MQGRLSVREDEAPRLIPDSVTPLSHIDISALKREAARDKYDRTPPPPAPDELPPAAPPLEPLPQSAPHKLYLKAGSEQARDQALAILARAPGDIRVTFVMADSGKAFLAPPRYWVSEGVDLAALRALLGDRAVVMK